ncbi:unnamed protein product [Sphagnum troendelagicum]|uniref:Secreted protein n=1 Tax=Sphagnum troendelagicum TaxID=128251 RepID=A0ABP0U769_9BRYO
MHYCCVFLVFIGASLFNLSMSLTFGCFLLFFFFVHSCCSSMFSYYALSMFFGPFKSSTFFRIFPCMCGRRQFYLTPRNKIPFNQH